MEGRLKPLIYIVIPRQNDGENGIIKTDCAQVVDGGCADLLDPPLGGEFQDRSPLERVKFREDPIVTVK